MYSYYSYINTDNIVIISSTEGSINDNDNDNDNDNNNNDNDNDNTNLY